MWQLNRTTRFVLGRHFHWTLHFLIKTNSNFFITTNILVYLDVDPINVLDPLRIFAFVGNSPDPSYKWNIKITLIDCKQNEEIQGIDDNPCNEI